MDKRSALVFGASGLVGTELIHLLLEHPEYQSVHSFGRSKLDIKHPKLQQLIVDFEAMNKQRDVFKNKDVYCCLGTTIKKAKTREAFRRVDYDFVVNAAALAKEQEVENFAVISSLGANKASRNFYLKTKGEMEAALSKLNFKKLRILRPSILLGNRKEKRLGEKIGIVLIKVLNPLLIGKLKKYRGVHAHAVARKMISATLSNEAGTTFIESDLINK